MSPAIRGVKVFLTAPKGIDLVVTRVETTEPGLHGLGCATLTTRPLAVRAAIEEHLVPLLAGRSVDAIEDNWQIAYQSSYWRNGPVTNNALSGVDMALWDIKAKMAGVPLYQLFGGKCREAAAVYRHASGATPAAVVESARQFVADGYSHVRCQLGGYGGAAPRRPAPEGAAPGAYFDPSSYARSTRAMLEEVRAALGPDVELLHDVHERLPPIDAVRLAKELEQCRLFFLEDPLPPEQNGWFSRLREQAAVPIAMGELFTHPGEWLPLVAERLIDFIRVHISAIGGLTPARKLAACCEAFGVRTAWHGPGDCSPVAHAANLHLELASPNFGVHEWGGFAETEQAVFPGCPEVRGGYMYPNASPGLGVDLDEAEAGRFPIANAVPGWVQARSVDGTAVRP